MNNSVKLIDSIPYKINYYPTFFGLDNISTTGKYARICVLDTGVPKILNHYIDEYRTHNFTRSKSIDDDHGHSTSLTSVLNTKSPIKGIATDADVFYGKIIIDNPLHANVDDVIQAILWCIVREIDVILLSFAISVQHSGLHDVIKKAFKNGIALIAASGNHTEKSKDVLYPAAYDEVFSVGFASNITHNRVIKKNTSFGLIMPYIECYAYYLQNKFVKFGGSSLNASVIAAYSCLLIEEMRIKGIDPKNPQLIYNNLCLRANKK
jgi:hypothetical protein